MKKKLSASYLIVAALAVTSLGTVIYAASAPPAVYSVQAQDSGAARITLREMGFEGSAVMPVYVTSERPDNTWFEIRNEAGETLLVIDKAETSIDETTGLLMVSKAYYESIIKPIIEGASAK